jgi:chromosome segregation ATPase
MLHLLVLLSSLALGVSDSLERHRRTLSANANANANANTNAAASDTVLHRQLNSGLLSGKQRLLASALLAERQRLRRENGQLRNKLVALRQKSREMEDQLQSHKSGVYTRNYGVSKSLGVAAAQLRAALEDAHDASNDEADEEDDDDDDGADDVRAIIAPPTPPPIDQQELQYEQAVEAKKQLQIEAQERKQASIKEPQLKKRIAALQQQLKKDQATSKLVHKRKVVLERTLQEQEHDIISTQRSLADAQQTLNKSIASFAGPNSTAVTLKEEVAKESAEQRKLQKKKTALILKISSLREQLNSTSFKAKNAVARSDRARERMKDVMIARIGDLEDDQEQLDRSLSQVSKAAAKQKKLRQGAEQEVTKLQAGLKEDEKAKAKADAQATSLTSKTKALRKNLTQSAKARRLAALKHANETAKLRNTLVAKVRDLEDQEERLDDSLQMAKIQAKERAGNHSAYARRLMGHQKMQLRDLSDQLEQHSDEAANATNKSREADKVVAMLQKKLKMYKGAEKNASNQETKLKKQFQETQQEVVKIQRETGLLKNTTRKNAKASKARVQALQKELKDISKSAKKEGADSVKQLQAAMKSINKAKKSAQLETIKLDAELKTAKEIGTGLKMDLKKVQAANENRIKKFAAEDKKGEAELAKLEGEEKAMQTEVQQKAKKVQASLMEASNRAEKSKKKLALMVSHQQVLQGQEQQLQKEIAALRRRKEVAQKAQAKQDADLQGLHAQEAQAASDTKSHEAAAAKAKAAADAEEKQVNALKQQATTLEAQLHQNGESLAKASQRQRAAAARASEYAQKSAKIAKERDQLSGQVHDKQTKTLAWQKKVAEERAEIQSDATKLVQEERADSKHRVLLKQLYAFSRQQQARMKTIAAALTPAEKRALRAKEKHAAHAQTVATDDAQ